MKKARKVYLKDIWPSHEEVDAVVKASARTEFFAKEYSEVFEGDLSWESLEIRFGNPLRMGRRAFDIHPPSAVLRRNAGGARPSHYCDDARALALLGDSVTTDHISPAGMIKPDSPAGN